MVTIDNETLRDVYHYLKTIENVIEKEVKLVIGNKFHLDKMVPEQLSKVYSTKAQTALAFVDKITRTAKENALISLVSTFEKIVFAKYRTSYGTIRSTINRHSTKPLDYYNSRERFVNDKIENLAGILGLLDGIVDKDLFEKLITIKEQRNYIAHGKRDVKSPTIEYSIDDIATILDDAITEIEQ